MGQFNGTIDEVQIYNYALSAEQISALYNNRTDLIVSQETSGGEDWSCSITPNDLDPDGDTKDSNNVTISNPPNTVEVILNSTNGLNKTNESLSCYGKGQDAETGTLTAFWKWYKDDVLNLSGSTGSISNDTLTLIMALDSGNTSKGEEWKCSIIFNDGSENETD